MLFREYNVPFRVSHRIVGALVRALIDDGKALSEVTPELLAKISENILGSPLSIRSEDLYKAINPASFVESHNVRGGPSRREVERMISVRKSLISKFKDEVSSLRRRIEDSIANLNFIVKSYVTQTFHSKSMKP
jgi:argininosuccinate lyase